MIIVADPLKPFVYTPKGAPKRRAILENYNTEIDRVYADVEKSSQISSPLEWSQGSLLNFVRGAVNDVLKYPAKDHEDIFECGCDRFVIVELLRNPIWCLLSLQATWIKHSIGRVLQEKGSSIASLNFVYEHPTISALAKYVMARAQFQEPVTGPLDPASVLASYIKDFPVHTVGKEVTSSFSSSSAGSFLYPYPWLITLLGVQGQELSHDVVLITGTTGALGSASLAKLVALKSVAKIYALNRRSKQGVAMVERQEQALISRGYDPGIAKSHKVILVEGDLTRDGLQVEAYLREEVDLLLRNFICPSWISTSDMQKYHPYLAYRQGLL